MDEAEGAMLVGGSSIGLNSILGELRHKINIK